MVSLASYANKWVFFCFVFFPGKSYVVSKVTRPPTFLLTRVFYLLHCFEHDFTNWAYWVYFTGFSGLVVLLVVLLMTQRVFTTNITQMDALYQQLTTGYNTALLPRNNDENPVNIQMSIHLLSIDNFNEISGTLKMTIQFKIEWSEFRMKWQFSNFGGVESFQIPSTSVWKPSIYLRESAFKYEPIGVSDTGTVRVSSTGSVLWRPGEIVFSTCSVDVLNFPFDTQMCELNFSPKDSLAVEVTLSASSNQLQLTRYVENSRWELSGSEITELNQEGEVGDISSLTLKLSLKRRNLFYIYYILCPLFFPGCLKQTRIFHATRFRRTYRSCRYHISVIRRIHGRHQL